MPVADALRDYIETTAVQVERGATTSLGMDVMALAPGTKLGIVWMDPINNAALLLGTPTVEQYAADGGLGTIQDTTPSGYYVVVPCAGACDSLNSVLTTLGQPDAKWEALEVPTKISDLSVAPQVGDTATADHLDLAWKYAEAAPDDKIAVVWSKEGKEIAELSDGNLLQKTLGFLDSNRLGTRLYNTPLIGVAPLLPDVAPGLAEALPPGAYQVEVFVNGALEAVGQANVGQ
ncbi:MAG: hypothetical protein U0X20_22900 [Caldilineaceae bacterium]